MSGLADLELWKSTKERLESGKAKIMVKRAYSEEKNDTGVHARLNSYYHNYVLRFSHIFILS
jgi:hypothetical protein